MSWKLSSAFEVNAICVPSGDHAGHVSCTFGVAVRRVTSLPSASIVKMSQFPILLPAHLE